LPFSGLYKARECTLFVPMIAIMDDLHDGNSQSCNGNDQLSFGDASCDIGQQVNLVVDVVHECNRFGAFSC
jgi:hypothetical protein